MAGLNVAFVVAGLLRDNATTGKKNLIRNWGAMVVSSKGRGSTIIRDHFPYLIFDEKLSFALIFFNQSSC